MATFRFNFAGNDNGRNTTGDLEKPAHISWLECEQVVPDIHLSLDIVAAHAKMFVAGDIEIGYVVAKQALLSLGNRGLNAELAEKEHSDLVPGMYEGGLKIWECTQDLVQYLSQNESDIKLKNTKVLDLGCGVGILGIYAFINGANVTFQDYNREVLECITIPNVLLNIEDDDKRELEMMRCTFFSGDWASFDQKLSNNLVYDVILTSETIYNTQNYNKIIYLFANRLSKEGVIYVAAKTCYFGVGGGTKEFVDAIKRNGHLNSEMCWKSSGGIQREIWKITRNK